MTINKASFKTVMKRKHILLGCLAIALLDGTFWLRTQRAIVGSAGSEQIKPGVAQSTSETAPTVSVSPAPESDRPISVQKGAPQRAVAVAPAGSVAQPQKIRIRADQMLATVNGVAITLKDLMPLRPEASAQEHTLEPDRYELLLNRAVERELAFQTAQAEGVKITEAQAQNLAKRQAENAAVDPTEFDNLGRSKINTEFEQRDAAGRMLLHSLAAAAGDPIPHVTTVQVQNYYAQHQRDYPTIPQDPVERRETAATIDAAIRAQLAPALKAQYDEQFRQFVERLKAGAQITVARPS